MAYRSLLLLPVFPDVFVESSLLFFVLLDLELFLFFLDDVEVFKETVELLDKFKLLLLKSISICCLLVIEFVDEDDNPELVDSNLIFSGIANILWLRGKL